MRSTQVISVLAFASAAVAAPQGWGNWGPGQQTGDNESGPPQGNWQGGRPQVTETAIATATAYTTVVYGGSWPAPTGAPSVPSVPQAPAPAPESPAPEASSTWATWAPAPSAPSGGSSDTGYMSIVNEYRSAMGHPTLTQSSTLEGNAQKTVDDSHGQMVHELNPGSMAQVLAPGTCEESAFKDVYVGGWLCEIPSAAGLDGICSSLSAGWSYDGQTGHADILNSNSYTKIGCSCATGIWACDLA